MKYFSLSFFSCRLITDKGIKALSESFKKQKELKELTLVFERYPNPYVTFLNNIFLKSCDKITDVGFESINEALNELRYIESINFNFSWLVYFEAQPNII